MASGFQFAGEISKSAAEVLYTPGANRAGVCNVNILNAGDTSIRVRLGYAASATTSASAYLEYGALVGPHQVLERTAIFLSGTQTLIAECETASLCYVTLWSSEDTL